MANVLACWRTAPTVLVPGMTPVAPRPFTTMQRRNEAGLAMRSARAPKTFGHGIAPVEEGTSGTDQGACRSAARCRGPGEHAAHRRTPDGRLPARQHAHNFATARRRGGLRYRIVCILPGPSLA